MQTLKVRSLLGNVRERSLLGIWECDSEARPRNRFLGCGRAIAKRDLGIAFLGM
ncbi:hypothetical protein WJM97_11475 [Okeanomitos corallinicola TIOX110]|uniref:Uncharacterized protein n=1 Tax=Okeanomitos corallinicola TIOX110 TaxID=3133117 RepID=A0ABZ2UPF1_9CYAN